MRDNITEARLDREGVQWTYVEEVPIVDIDVRASLGNQARFDPINRANVERYALKMIDGEPFPAIILFRKEKDTLVAIDGNHRIAAATEAEKVAIDAYVLTEMDALTVMRLTRTWNIGNGQGLSRDEIVETAIYFAHNTPYSLKDIAKMVGMNERTLGGYIRHRETKDRLFKLGVPAEGMGQTHVERLGGIKDDAVLAEAARLVIRAGLPIAKVESLVQDIGRAKSEQERMAVVRGWVTHSKASIAVAGAGRYTSATRRREVTRLINYLQGIAKLCGRAPNAAKLGLVLEADIVAVQTASAEASNRLRRLLDSAQTAKAS